MKRKLIYVCVTTAVLLFSSCMSMSGLPVRAVPEQSPEPAVFIPEAHSSAITVMPSLAVNTTVRNLNLMVTPVSTGSVSDIDLAIPAKFNITRPADKFTTTYEKYFITGTSNPNSPVYFGDAEIDRIGTKGTFGVLVDLKMGSNTFKFRQGDKTETVTITRKTYVSPDSVPISEIRQASMVPAQFSGVKVGEDLAVSCIAPSGASVTATFDGESVNLNQVAPDRKAGLPSLFTGSITVPDKYDSALTQKVGKVSYKMKYNGKTGSYQSSGDVYVAGRDSRIAVRVQSYMGFVYPNLNDLSKFREKLKKGAADYIDSQDNTYAELASGGYVLKEQLSVIEGNVAVGNKLSKVKSSAAAKKESYTFTGTRTPVYITGISDGKFTITLCNTSGTPDIDVSGSKLFSSVAVAKGGSYVTYTFTIKDAGKLWGYNINYDGKSTVLSFNYKPVLKSGSLPFEGMTIVLDPGHGGTDNGALGLAGITGPGEKDVNLAHAYTTRDLLESMGADVVLTRSQDMYFSLDDRLKASEELKADMFISLHHNSIGENVDANKISGMEVYYHNALSKNLAQSMMSGLSSELSRNNRFTMQSYYRVTLSPYAPAILVELGYLSNPLEYEKAANTSQISKVANAVATGIKKALS